MFGCLINLLGRWLLVSLGGGTSWRHSLVDRGGMIQNRRPVDWAHSLSDTQAAVREPIKVPASLLARESQRRLGLAPTFPQGSAGAFL